MKEFWVDKEFWKDTGNRMAWTFAQAMLGCMSVGQALTEIKWVHALSISAVAALISFFKQIVKYSHNGVELMTGAILAREMTQLHDYPADTTEEPEDSWINEENETNIPSEVNEDGEE